MKQLFFIILLILSGFQLKSQTVHQQTYFFRLYARVKFNDKWTLHAETDYRRFTNPDRMWQSFSQLHLHYKFCTRRETAAALSYAVVWQGTLPVPEWRPYQLLQYTQPFNHGWALAYRLQFEERFIHHSSKTELTEGFGFKLRPRLRIQLAKLIDSNWTVRLSEEYFYQINDGFNQSQTWLSIERQLGHGYLLDLGYLKTFLNRAPNGYINRDNVRLSLIKSFSFKSV